MFRIPYIPYRKFMYNYINMCCLKWWFIYYWQTEIALCNSQSRYTLNLSSHIHHIKMYVNESYMIMKNTVGKHVLFSHRVKQKYLYRNQYKGLASTKLSWSKIYSSSSDSIDWDCKSDTFNCVDVPTHVMETSNKENCGDIFKRVRFEVLMEVTTSLLCCGMLCHLVW